MKIDTDNMKEPVLAPKGYYVPMVLANGEDFCQVDFTGSMGFKDHIKGYMSFWYKKGRPNAWHERGIAKLIYVFHSDKGPVELGGFSQRFDPVTAILKTRLLFYQLKMEIETFLSEDHSLIEIYRVLESESRKSFLSFNIGFPDRSYSGKTILLLDDNAAKSLSVENGVQSFRYAYKDADENFSGIGLSGMKLLEGAAQIKLNPEGSAIEIRNLSAGDHFVRASTLVDSINGSGFETEARNIHSAYMAKSEAELLNGQISTYSKYCHSSSFSCSDKGIEELFNTSLYVCGAALHPNGSIVSALEIPNNHGMGTYWDIWFTHAGLLRTNRVQQAMKVLKYWDLAYAKAREIAKDAGLKGARFEWLLRYDGTPYLPEIAEQIHNNVIPLLNIYEQYLYTGDKAILSERFELMQDCVHFVIDFALRKNPDTGRHYLKELQPVDESAEKKKNEVLTASITRRGIDIITAIASIIGKTPDKLITDSAAAFDEILADLKKDGVYMAYDGSTVGTWGSILAYIHRPDPDNFKNALAFSHGGCQEQHGLGVGATSRMRCATFPWVEGIFAWSAAVNNNHDAPKYLKLMMRFTNYFGGLHEYLFLHGEPSRDWFVAAHGVFIAALADILVRREDDTITVFPCGTENLPEKITFSNFRLPGQLLVSVKNEKGLYVKLENMSDMQQKITLKSGGYSTSIVLESKSHFEKTIASDTKR